MKLEIGKHFWHVTISDEKNSLLRHKKMQYLFSTMKLIQHILRCIF